MTFADAAEQHLDDVFAYLVYLTGDRGAAEDLAAETFEKALRLWRRFDERRGSARTCSARSRARPRSTGSGRSAAAAPARTSMPCAPSSAPEPRNSAKGSR